MPIKDLTKNTATVFKDYFFSSLKNKKAILITAIYLIVFYIGLKIFDFLSSISSASVTWVIAPHYISLIIMPFLSILLCYNTLNNERSNGAMKYIVSKISRESIVIGRFLGVAFILSIIIGILMAIASLYTFSRTGSYLGAEFFYEWVFLSIYAVAFASLSIFISAIVKSSHQGLILLFFIVFSMLVIQFIKSYYIKYLSLFNFVSFNFFDIFSFKVNAAFNWIPLVAWTFVYLIFSLIIFQRCDV